MNISRVSVFLVLLSTPFAALPRTMVPPEDLIPQESSWETGYQSRVSTLVNASTWSIGSGAGDTDIGKRDWPALLAEMWKDRNDDVALQAWIDGKGMQLINSSEAGRFYKAFSVPGYNMFYFNFRDYSPTVGMTSTQINQARNINSWSYLTREDNYMDPIYGQTEFNSENFNWMARLGGLQWAFELPDTDLGSYTRNWQAGQPKGMSRAYFRNYMDNWTRALFNTGRVEWNSSVYWGYTFHPIITLMEHPPVDAADPDYADKVALQARAGADWMVLELALHYLDGFNGGPDSRGKNNAYRPFWGSGWPSSYIYFAETGHMPTYDIATAQSKMSRNLVGWFPWSSYRPLNVLKSIAQRDFELPVEIQSAKPFYHLDHDNYGSWSGDGSYSQWKANKTTEELAHRTGFRYEFETIYMDTHYTLASIATYRPSGSPGTFSEHNLFRLMVKGTNAGAVHVSANTGFSSDPSGRDPYEQMGQYGNVVMRVTKNPNASRNSFWFNMPTAANRVTNGNRLFVDMGNGVYFAVLPLGSPSLGETAYNDSEVDYRKHTWSYGADELAAVIMEVGTAADHGSFANFQAAFTSLNVTSPASNEVEYTASDGKHIRMQWTGIINDYPMTENGGYTLSTGGTIPRTWRDGTEVDYESWNTYETVEGEEIVYQEWGSGLLRMAAGGEAVEIEVDPVTAEVTYYEADPGVVLPYASIMVLDDEGDESGANPLVFEVGLNEVATTPIVVNLGISGSADMADFTSVPDISGGSVTIPSSQSSVTITLTPVDDGIEEPDEAFLLNVLSGADYRRTAPYGASGTVTGVGRLTVSASGSPAENPFASGQFTLERDPARSTEAIVVEFSISGDATADVDYTLSGTDTFNPGSGLGTVTLTAGQSQAILTVTPIDDGDPEGAESVVLALVDGSGYAPGSPDQATLAIDDDERIDSNTEQFSGSDPFDLSNTRLTFVPQSDSVYLGYAEPITAFEVDIASTGTQLSLGDDSNQQVTLPGGTTVPFFGIDYAAFRVGSNGYVTFGSGDTDFGESIADHFDLPRVSLFFDDLNPGLGGSIRWETFADRVVVQYTAVQEFGGGSSNTGQVEFFHDGVVRISYLGVGLNDAVAGLSPGSYDSGTFEETDLSTLPALPVDPWLTWQDLYFTPAEISAGLADPGADAETIPDGVPNIIEHALGMHPRENDAHLASLHMGSTNNSGTPVLTIQVRRNPEATGITFSLEALHHQVSAQWLPELPYWEGDTGLTDPDGTPVYEFQVEINGQSALYRVRFEPL